MPGNSIKQSDSDFEVITDDQWAAETGQKTKWNWTHDGYWDAWPKGSEPTREDLDVIHKHLLKAWKQDRLPRMKKGVWWILSGRKSMSILDKLQPNQRAEVFRDVVIWMMPFYHTKYMSEVTAYYDWLWAGGPHAVCGSPPCAAKTDPLRDVCRAIANERKAIRLAGLRK